MKEIITLVEFKLNEGIDISEWKEMSSKANGIVGGIKGFQFRYSGVDNDGTVYCILKWDSAEDSSKFDDVLATKPEIGKEFERLCDMKTMKMKNINVI
ncbi:MAG: hypothetical protein Q9M94_06365 [Candidatus Gracilibacteria bacterium]|nr:hypothetical protein [Candidatus Gracilibacteria bacterium]